MCACEGKAFVMADIKLRSRVFLFFTFHVPGIMAINLNERLPIPAKLMIGKSKLCEFHVLFYNFINFNHEVPCSGVKCDLSWSGVDGDQFCATIW